jgi:polysaccharide biosynthesis transport protein
MGIALRRKWWITLPTLGLFVMATLLARGIPDLYRAETVILVDLQRVPDKYIPEETMAANIADRLKTLEQQILSPTRLKRLVESEHLYPDPTGTKTEEQVVKSVHARIAVEVLNPGGPKLGAFKIIYSATRRDEVARVAQHIAKVFVNENQNTGVDQGKGTKDFIESQLQETKRRLDERENQLSLIKTRNMFDLPESKLLHFKALAGLRTQYQAIQEKVSQNQQDKAILQSKLTSGGEAPAADVDTRAGRNGTPARAPSNARPPSLRMYEMKIQELEGKLVELRKRYGPTHPYVRTTQAELDRLKASTVAKSQDQQWALETTAPRRNNPVLEAQIAKLDQDSAEQTKQLESLKKQMDFHKQRLERISAVEQQLAGLQRDYDTLKTEYTRLLDKERAEEITSTLETHQRGEHFVVLDPAVPPETPYAPNRVFISLGGLLGGLLGGIALAFIAEMKDQCVRTENEASRIFGKPVLGGIPRIVSLRERRRRRLNAVGIIAGTVAGAAGLGSALWIVAARHF